MQNRTLQTASASRKAAALEIVVVAPPPGPDDPNQTRFDLSAGLSNAAKGGKDPATPAVNLAAPSDQTSVEYLLEQIGRQDESAAAQETSGPKAPAPKVHTKPAEPTVVPAASVGRETLAEEWVRLTAGLTPPPKSETLAQKLRSRLPLLRKSHRGGLSWKQLVGVVAKVNIVIKESYLRKLVGGRRRGSRRSRNGGTTG